MVSGPTRAGALLGISLAFVAAGCGAAHHSAQQTNSRGTAPLPGRLSKAAYSARLQAMADRLVGVINLLESNPSQFDSIVGNIGRAEKSLRATVDELASLRTPTDAASENRAFVAGLRSLASSLTGLKQAVRHHNARQVAAFEQGLGRSPRPGG